MSRLDKFVNDLAQVARDNKNNPKFAQQRIQSLLEISLNSTYNNTICVSLFELPSYQEVLDLSKRLNYKVLRNDKGIHILKFVGQEYSYVYK